MPLPRLDFTVHDRSGQIVFALELDPTRTRGARPTFGPLVYFSVTQVRDATGPFGTHRPLMLGGSLCWTGETDGLAVPAQPLLLNRNELAVPIADEQMARLEDRRAGGEATLSLQLWGIAEQSASGHVEAVMCGTFAQTFSVPRDRWLAVLDQCGFGKRRIVELPAAPVCGGSWDGVSARIEAASRELAAGRSGASLVETRVALQRLTDALGSDLGIAREKNSFANYVEAIGKKLEEFQGDRKGAPYDLVAKLIKTAFGFASEPPHQGLDRSARDDAELALSTVTMLYSYLARQAMRFPDKAANDASS